MIKYSTEFRFPFSENPVVYAMLFAEAGSVWNDSQLMHSLALKGRIPRSKRSAGIGIRFFMPMIGMLGLTWGMVLMIFQEIESRRVGNILLYLEDDLILRRSFWLE